MHRSSSLQDAAPAIANGNQKIALVAFLLSVNFLYFISSAYITTSNDGSHFALTAALYEDGSLIIDKYIAYTTFVDFNFKDGHFFSDRPPGTALLALPFYHFGRLLEDWGLRSPPIPRTAPIEVDLGGKLYRFTVLDRNLAPRRLTEVSVLLLPNLAGSLAAWLMFGLFRRFKFDFNTALLSSAIFAFSTFVWFESTHLYSHIHSMTLVLAAVYLVIRVDKIDGGNGRTLVWMSALLAWASIVEIQNVLLVPIFLAYLIVAKKLTVKIPLDRDTARSLLFSALTFGAIYAILLLYNYAAFKDLTIKSNQYSPFYPEEKSIWSSLADNPLVGLDLLFTNFLSGDLYWNWARGVKNNAPGLFVLSPILVLSVLGFRDFYRSHRREAIFFLLLIAALVGVAALHQTVLTRHIVTAIPYLFFPLAYFVENISSGKHSYWWAALIGALFLLSTARVYYVMNSHFSRSLGDPFIFLRELPTFFIAYGFTAAGLILWLAVRKCLGAKRKDVTT